ncbi:MAG: type II secretion system protein [Kiritimatiellae bacterium]|nr:type II secretion system protein [Kiritimatiellia bacterium]
MNAIRHTSAGARRRAGFTFVEVLAAMLFVAVLFPVIIRGLLLANWAAVTADRDTTAVQLAENRLNELLLNGEWAASRTQGDFGEEWPGYRWELTRADWEADNMVELTVSVLFEVQGAMRQVSLTTLVNETDS